MSPQEIDALRKEVKKRMVDLDLDRPGSIAVLSGRLALRREKAVNPNSLIMALSGYRSGPAAQELLLELREILEAWPPENPAV